MSLFEAQKVTKTFGGLTAVNNVDFTIEEGMIAGLIGPNGAGKTTFFNGMTGVYPITSGQMIFDGHDITRLKPFQVTALGIARTFQNIRLFANMTAIENVLVGEHCRLHSNLLGQILHDQADHEGRGRGARQGPGHARVRRPAPLGCRRDRQEPALWPSAPSRDRPRAGHPAQAAAAGRADRRHEPQRDRTT